MVPATATPTTSPPAPGPEAVGRALRWLWRVLCWTVVLALVAVLAVAVVVPRLAGATPYTVLSGSMGPAYPVGSLIVVRPREPSEIAVGDVVTYQLRSGEPVVVTHRVVASRTDAGERVFRTQGDVNTAPDAEPVREVQVRGVVWYSVPLLGYVNHALGGGTRQLLAQVVAVGLAGYAVVMFAAAARERRRSGPGVGG